MSAYFLGQYLLNKGLIKRDDLADALDLQCRRNLPIGVPAVFKGFMTEEQVKEIHECQKEIDKPFGRLALEKNYLSQEQLDELLELQTADYIFLGEALMELGRLTPDIFAKAVNEYAKSQKALQRRQSDLISGFDTAGFSEIIVDAVEDAFSRFAGICIKPGSFCGDTDYTEYDSCFYSEIALDSAVRLRFSLALPEFPAGEIASILIERNEASDQKAALQMLHKVTENYIVFNLRLRGYNPVQTQTRMLLVDEIEDLLPQLVQICLHTPNGWFLLGFRTESAGE